MLITQSFHAIRFGDEHPQFPDGGFVIEPRSVLIGLGAISSFKFGLAYTPKYRFASRKHDEDLAPIESWFRNLAIDPLTRMDVSVKEYVLLKAMMLADSCEFFNKC